MTIQIFLADDHALVRDGLRALLEAQPDLQVVGEAANGRDAVRRVSQLRPDVTILDIAMPELNGLEAARQIRQECEGTQIIILSMYRSTAHVFEALRVGARGYLLKGSAGARVASAVQTVHTGGCYLSPEILEGVLSPFHSRSWKETGETPDPLARLSPREFQALQLVFEGRE